MYAWGSNLQCQLGKKLPNIATGNGSILQVNTSIPVHLTAYEESMPIQISCGSYHNLVLSRAVPRLDNPSLDNQIVTTYGIQGDSAAGGQNNKRGQEVAYEHKDEDCPNLENMKKLKAEVKRLR